MTRRPAAESWAARPATVRRGPRLLLTPSFPMNLPCKLLLMSLWLCAMPPAHAAPDALAAPPRAWLVTRGDAVAVVVGETHVDTALEFDPYFDSVVEPAFRAADLALVESYFGPENLANLGFNLTAPCDAAVDTPRSARVAERFAQLADAARRLDLDVPPWMAHWEAFPDIALVSSYLPDYLSRQIAPAIAAALRQPDDWSGVSLRLTDPSRLAAGRHGQIAGLDTVARVRANFCAASPADREDALVNVLDSVLGRLRMLDDARRTGRLADFRAGMSADLVRTLSCIASDAACDVAAPAAGAASGYGLMPQITAGVFNLSVQKRTHDWLPIVLDAMDHHRRTFVVVGAMHLADLRWQGQVRPGLLSLLHESGCEVRPIRSATDIQQPFLRQRWWDRLLAF